MKGPIDSTCEVLKLSGLNHSLTEEKSKQDR